MSFVLEEALINSSNVQKYDFLYSYISAVNGP